MPTSSEHHTQAFIENALPMMADAAFMNRDEAIKTYLDFMDQLTDVMGDVSQPGVSNFSWETLYGIIDDTNDANRLYGRRELIAEAAANVSVLVPATDSQNEIVWPFLTEGGTFVTVRADGSPVAADNVFNPLVPPEYGCIHPAAFRKVAVAFMIEGICHQGADWGEGYKEFTAIMHEINTEGTLGPDYLPTIGMASEYLMAFDPAYPNALRGLMFVTGTTGRTLKEDFRAAVLELPAYAEYQMPENPADIGAGWGDTQSGTVANRVAKAYITPEEARIVGWPDPLHPDNRGVNQD